MGVNARIKILECKNFEEVENKVNDFLAFDKEIEHVARINYQLEYNVVIVEYVVFGSEEERRERNEIIMRAVAEEVAEEEYNVAVANNNPFTYWLKFFFPFAFPFSFPSLLSNFPSLPSN